MLGYLEPFFSSATVDNKDELTMICCNNISNISNMSGWNRFGLQV